MRERRGNSGFVGGVRDLTLNLTIISLCVILIAFIWKFVPRSNSPENDVTITEEVIITPPAITTIVDLSKVNNIPTQKNIDREDPLQRNYNLDLRNGTSRNGLARRYESTIEDKTKFNILKATNAKQQDHMVSVIHDYDLDIQSVRELQKFLGLSDDRVMKRPHKIGEKYFAKLILGDDAVDFALKN